MKLTYAAVAALLMGTSAMAWSPADPVASKWSKVGEKLELSSADFKAAAPIKATAVGDFADAKAAPGDAMAWADSAFKAEPASWTAEAPKLQPAAATYWTDEAPKPALAAASWDDKQAKMKPELLSAGADGNASSETADIRYGEWPTEAEEQAAIAAKADLGDALVEEDVPVDDAIDGETPREDDSLVPASPPVANGVGGPEDTVASDLTPRPAAHNYPPCDPGPGDDNCIQLYEPGVRTALASWNAPTGGLDSGTATAMGGPYEPVDEEMATADASGMDAAKLEEVHAVGGGK